MGTHPELWQREGYLEHMEALKRLSLRRMVWLQEISEGLAAEVLVLSEKSHIALGHHVPESGASILTAPAGGVSHPPDTGDIPQPSSSPVKRTVGYTHKELVHSFSGETIGRHSVTELCSFGTRAKLSSLLWF